MNAYEKELWQALHEAAFEVCFYCHSCGKDEKGKVDIFRCQNANNCFVKNWLATLKKGVNK